MKPKQIVLLSVAALAVNAVAFQAGRHWPRPNSGREDSTHSESVTSSSNRSGARADDIDLANARITNIGQLGFEQAFDLLCDAGPELRERWAKELNSLPYTAPAQQRAAVDTFYRILVQLEPKEAAALVMTSGVGISVVDMMVHAVPDQSLADVADVALKFNQTWPPPVVDLMWRWSQVNPVAASKFLDAHPEIARDSEMYILLANWAAVDLFSAKTWLDKAGAQQNAEALRGLLTGWAINDRAGAVEYLIAHAREENLSGAFRDVTEYLFRKSPEEARAFVLRLPDDESKNAAIGDVVGLAGRFGSGFWRQSPQVIANWLGSLPADLTREHFGAVGAAWHENDLDGFQTWVTRLPRDARDEAIAGYCEAASYLDDLGVMITLAESIRDESLRKDALKTCLARSDKTPDEAIEIVANLSLPVAQKTSVAQMIQKK